MTYSSSDITRFLSKIKLTDKGCWEWQGGVNTAGYGQFAIHRGGKFINKQAHRVSYEMFKGDAAGKNVCHTCDNRYCVRPEHLWLGTQAENIRDAVAKGRLSNPVKTVWYRKGRGRDEARAYAVLWLLGKGWNIKKTARYIGVSRALVKKIKIGEIWGHLGRPATLVSLLA
ncbi:HNH endonuclease signature motif containing protein [Rhizobium sp. Nf11,1]|uniref:HNH endonuclease signature motif containing protein n=1 Tax=Rhizobium sp. Nf11,1 TaxID=3404923 RepID=UPI003D33C725